MQKKPAEKAADVIKTAEEKVTERVAETKAAVKEAEAKVVEAAQMVEEKAEEKVAEIKDAAKAEEKKAPVKKAAAAVKKTAAAAKKSAEKKEELVPEVYIQYQDHEDVVNGVIERAKAAYIAEGHKASAIKSLQVYLKPEENAAYYVVNQKYAGKVYLF